MKIKILDITKEEMQSNINVVYIFPVSDNKKSFIALKQKDFVSVLNDQTTLDLKAGNVVELQKNIGVNDDIDIQTTLLSDYENELNNFNNKLQEINPLIGATYDDSWILIN